MLLLAFTVFFALYIRDHFSEFVNVSEVSARYLLAIGSVSLAGFVVNGLFLKVLLARFGIEIDFMEHFSLSIVTSFGNIFLPMKGGAGIRAVYLKSKYNFDYSYFVASLAGNYLVCFGVTGMAALGGMGFYWASAGFFSVPAALVFFSITAGALWAILRPPRTADWIPLRRAKDLANQMLAGWHIVRESSRTVLQLLGLTTLNMVLGSVTVWLEFAAFGMKDIHGSPIGLAQSAVFSAISGFSIFVGLTPAALGVRESVLMFSSEILGITPLQALAVSLLDRTLSFLVLAIFFAFASLHIKKRLRAKAPVI